MTTVIFVLAGTISVSAFEDNELTFDTSPPIVATQGSKYGKFTAPVLSRDTVRAMAAAASKYDAIVQAGGWAQIPDGETLGLGSVSPRVHLLRQRLQLTGDLKRQAGFAQTYDSFVAEAVSRFQKRHGLRQNGSVDKPTLAALNVTASVRLAQIQLNLPRISKITSKRIPKRFVMVNIPDSRLEAVEGNKVAARHRVVVGKPQFQTPVLKASIIELNFYPYWHVPTSIARRDILPKLTKNRDYLRKTNLRVLETWGGRELDPESIDWLSPEAQKVKFRQDPGTQNALGALRLNMPNGESVYLHDTPLKRLFGREVRAYSAGCVRVQNIFSLAEWLLRPNGNWNRLKVRKVVLAEKSLNIALKSRVPVYFSYFTAWASPDGIVQFRPDIYSRDGALGLAGEDSKTLEKST